MNRKEYKEMFEEVKLSDDKIAQIEMAMRGQGRVKRFSVKKVVILAASMVLALSAAVLAADKVNEIISEYEIERRDVEPNLPTEVGEDIEDKGTIVSDELGKDVALNEVTLKTKTIAVMVNGQVAMYDIDVSDCLDVNGNISIGTVKQKLMDSAHELHQKIREDFNFQGSISMSVDSDEQGNIIVSVLSDDDPRNRVGWYYCTDDDGVRYLVAPKSADFDDDVNVTYLDDLNGEPCIPIPELQCEEVVYYNFTYKDERYAVALWWYIHDSLEIFDGKMYRTEVIKLTE